MESPLAPPVEPSGASLSPPMETASSPPLRPTIHRARLPSPAVLIPAVTRNSGVRVTREGKWYIGITLGVGVAALNTGNNLLYLLFGALLSLLVLSWVLSEVSLWGLSVVRRLPVRAQVGRFHQVEIEVYNSKKKIPSYAIEVEDLRAGQPADKRCFFLKISPISAQVAAYRRTPQRRGQDHHTGFRIATRFPFGLFEKSREIEAYGELLTYPAVDPIHINNQERGLLQSGSGVLHNGNGDDIIGVRPEREGDDPRDIYWRKSTVQGHRVLRERARETNPEIQLHLELTSPQTPDSQFQQQFELQIRELASRAAAHIKRGDRVVLKTSRGERLLADRAVGLGPLLRYLALVEPSPKRDT